MTFKHIIYQMTLTIAASVVASAATVSFNTGGMTCANAGNGICTSVEGAMDNQIDFNSATTPSPFVSGIASFSFTPSNVTPFVTGSVNSQYAAPPNDGSQYLSIGSPSRTSSVTIDFSKAINYYGLYLGSPDSYNLFTFFETGNNLTSIASFTGTDLLPPGDGNQSVGQYINFNVNGGTVGRIVLSSSGAALETDNHAYVAETPEPATMGLMGGSMLGMAFFLRRRRAASKNSAK